jgi:hypothetical protein
MLPPVLMEQHMLRFLNLRRMLRKFDDHLNESEAVKYIRSESPIVRFRDPREVSQGERKLLTFRAWGDPVKR